jgi:hypothetical protein
MRTSVAILCLIAAAASADPPSRPRVLMREKAADGCPGLDEIRELAKRKPWSDRVGDLKETTHGKALHWLLTGDEASAQACLDELKATDPDDGYGLYALGPLLTLPVAYDWLFSWKGFSAADRRAVEEKIAKTADGSVEFLKGNGDSVWHTSAPRAWMGIALAAAALDGPRAAEWEKFAREYFERVYAPAMAALEGGAVAGMSYGVAEGFMPAVRGMWALRTGRGADYFAWVKERGNWCEARLEYMALMAAPDHTWPRWGDCVGGSRASLKDEVRNVVDMLALGTGAPAGAWLSGRLAKAYPANAGYHSCVLPDMFLFSRDAAPPDGTEPPRAKLFGRSTLGQAVFRTGWDDAATHVFFKAGDYFDNHGHFDQGSFTIYRRGWLALDSGAYGKFDAPHRLEYARKSVAHNVIVFGKDDSGGQRIVNRQDFQDLADWEKKKRSLALESADVIGWETGDGWAWVAADLRAAYDPKVVGSFVRELVWLDSGALVVHDRCAAKTLPRWLLHTTPEPEIEGLAFAAALDATALRGWTLLPEKSEPKKIGPGCLVDGRDFPPDSSAPYAVPGAWRVEVAGSGHFLHVLIALDAVAAPPEVSLVRESGRVGAKVGDKTILLQADGFPEPPLVR